jgi:hypothetical protein
LSALHLAGGNGDEREVLVMLRHIGLVIPSGFVILISSLFRAIDDPDILAVMKASHLLSFLCGTAVMFGFSALSRSSPEPSHHIYELRLYQVNAGKMDALKSRFGDHTNSIFRRHHMNSIGYWVPEDAPGSQNLFIYILEHPSRPEAEKNWADFQADPEWKKVKAESEANGALVDHIDRYFMDPTSYSALK